MDILNTFSLNSNRKIKINFDGGDLSSDAGLLLIKEFVARIGFPKLIKKKFKTNDNSVRFHKDDENLMQMIYQIISAYFEDDCADELTLDPVFNAILEKSCLASQPTLSRFFNRMDEDTLKQFDNIDKCSCTVKKQKLKTRDRPLAPHYSEPKTKRQALWKCA